MKGIEQTSTAINRVVSAETGAIIDALIKSRRIYDELRELLDVVWGIDAAEQITNESGLFTAFESVDKSIIKILSQWIGYTATEEEHIKNNSI